MFLAVLLVLGRTLSNSFFSKHLFGLDPCSIGWDTRVHLREQKSKDSLPIFPIEVVQIDLFGVGLLTADLAVFSGSTHRRRSKRTLASRSLRILKLRTLHLGISKPTKLVLLLLPLNGNLLSDLFFDLLQGLKEELLDL